MEKQMKKIIGCASFKNATVISNLCLIANAKSGTLDFCRNLGLFILLFFFISCGNPPEHTTEHQLLSIIKENLDNLNDIKSNDKKQLQYFKDLTSKFDGIISFRKGSSIKFISHKSDFKAEYIAQTLENNNFIVLKDVYFTFIGKDACYSFDNITWVSSKSDPNTEVEGIRNDYHFSTQLKDNELTIVYSMGLLQGRNPIYINKKPDRPVIRLSSGLIFSHIDDKMVNADLEKNILFIPKNTLITSSMNVSGNLISSNTEQDKTITLNAIQDIFVYIKGKRFTLSFDKKNWNPNILSFDIKPDIFVTATSENVIHFDIEALANFEKDKISMSIMQLLLKIK